MRYSLLLLASFAYAAPVTLPQDISFTDGATSWEWSDVEVDGGLNIEDATFKSNGDAFDDTALLNIDGETYTPSNSADLSDVTVNSEVIGKVLTTETKTYSGLNVTNQYLFYSKIKQNSALVRQLAKFENTGSSSISIPIAFSGNLGSDSSTVRLGSSNGVFNSKTAWAVTADSITSPDDPVIGHAYRGASCVTTRPVAAVLQGDTVVQIFQLTVPAGQTRFLVNFFQVTDNNLTDGLAAAAGVFGSQEAVEGAGLFADLTETDKGKIANFGFTNCKADYRKLASNARNRIKKQIVLGSNGKAAISAVNKANALARRFGYEIALRSGRTQDTFLKASRASVAAVKAAAKAGETRASNFAALKTKAERAMNNLLNKIVAP